MRLREGKVKVEETYVRTEAPKGKQSPLFDRLYHATETDEEVCANYLRSRSPANDKDKTVVSALLHRNESWQKNPLIPTWVDVESVSLDQFFTRAEIASRCYQSLLKCMEADNAPLDDYNFIEPSAGGCSFYNLLPAERRTGIDILPLRDELICEDFLSWTPMREERLAVIGNPPFGYRAWLALAFVNHAAKFADYIGFILPMAFQSDGKGSPKHRVFGAKLVHSETLPPDSFTDAQGKPVKINALWQIWERGVNNSARPETCDSWVDLFTVDMRKERLCGQERMGEADCFIQRTYYGNKQPNPVKDFSDVKYVCGYGIVIHKQRRAVKAVLDSIDWDKYSNLAAHNCKHISMYHIRQALVDAGFNDG